MLVGKRQIFPLVFPQQADISAISCITRSSKGKLQTLLLSIFSVAVEKNVIALGVKLHLYSFSS